MCFILIAMQKYLQKRNQGIEKKNAEVLTAGWDVFVIV